MNWYKIAVTHEKFDDRNRLNRNIRKLESVVDRLRYAAKLVYQTQRGAQAFVKKVASEDVLASYPIILDGLYVANESALDSPQRFAEACYTSIEEIHFRISKLRKERRKIMDPSYIKKGLL